MFAFRGAYTPPAVLARIGVALTRGCVASISRIEAGEASRRRQIVVKELAHEHLVRTTSLSLLRDK
jgi:hypothetical protein